MTWTEALAGPALPGYAVAHLQNLRMGPDNITEYLHRIDATLARFGGLDRPARSAPTEELTCLGTAPPTAPPSSTTTGATGTLWCSCTAGRS